jgi:hypothetical protein
MTQTKRPTTPTPPPSPKTGASRKPTSPPRKRAAKPPADSGRHLTDQEHYNRTFDRWADRHLTSPEDESPIQEELELVDPATLPPYPKVVE